MNTSITSRISLLFSTLAVLVLLAMGYVINASVEHHFEVQDRMALEGKLALLQHLLAEPSLDVASNLSLHERIDDALVGHHELVLRLEATNGTLVFESSHAPPNAFLEGVFEPYSEGAFQLHDLSLEHHRFRAVMVLISAPVSGENYRVFLAIDRSIHDTFLENFHQQLIAVGALGLALICLFGWLATRHGLRPLTSMAQVAEGISAQKIQARLPMRHLPAELHSLGNSFNEMLDRLEAALARLNDFSSDIAHELRTPITNLMTQVQVSLSRDRSAEEYREVLYSSMEEYERLAAMISDMLFLAKSDNDQIVPRQEALDLRREVDALFEFYEPLASERGLQLACTGEAKLWGGRLMLQRAIGNLLSNAVRYAYADSVIEVLLRQAGASVSIELSNQGDTIPPETLSQLFSRFYRADAARHRSDEGAGLGLAITRSIVLAHRGSITVRSEQGVTRFEILLPSGG
ncbi:Heavy metal sensor kinase [gamma proteobacterium HdN1]|nr:Heavy metal sensor kinase [gamma proteobacterium HdN1]